VRGQVAVPWCDEHEQRGVKSDLEKKKREKKRLTCNLRGIKKVAERTLSRLRK
jgi:hypothetical protein